MARSVSYSQVIHHSDFLYYSLQIKQKHADEFGRGKRPPQCIFSAQWTREDLHPTIHNETIRLLGTRNTQSVTVTCVSGMVRLAIQILVCIFYSLLHFQYLH